MFPPPFFFIFFLNFLTNISFHFSRHPRIIRRSKLSSTVIEHNKLHRTMSKSGMGGGGLFRLITISRARPRAACPWGRRVTAHQLRLLQDHDPASASGWLAVRHGCGAPKSPLPVVPNFVHPRIFGEESFLQFLWVHA